MSLSGLSLDDVTTAVSIGRSLLLRNTELEDAIEALEQQNKDYQEQLERLRESLEQERLKSRQLVYRVQRLQEQVSDLSTADASPPTPRLPPVSKRSSKVPGSHGSGTSDYRCTPCGEPAVPGEIPELNEIVGRQQNEIEVLRQRVELLSRSNEQLAESAKAAAAASFGQEFRAFRRSKSWWAPCDTFLVPIVLHLDKEGGLWLAYKAKRFRCTFLGCSSQHAMHQGLPPESEWTEAKVRGSNKEHVVFIERQHAARFTAC